MRPRVRAFVFGATFSAAAAAGCQTPDPPVRPLPPAPPVASPTAVVPADPPTQSVTPAGHQVPVGQPAAAAGGPQTVAELEQLALARNPTLVQAGANVEDARGRAVQSGLYPNPTVGYNGEQIGTGRGSLGEQQGAFIDQTIVTAGKLRLNRAKFGQEVSQMEWEAVAQQYRVVNGVRSRYYQLLAMRQLIAVREEFVRIADDIVVTLEELVNVGQANKSDLLQGRIEARQARVGLENAKALYLAAWKQLAAFVGQPDLPAGQLQGDLETGDRLPDFDTTLAHLLEASPELQVARAEVARNQFALRREQLEPIPNVQLRNSTGYNYEVDRVTTTVNVGVRLPVFDKNQGNIRSATAQLAKAQADVGRVELDLQRRMARTYARYQTTLAVVELYRPRNPEVFQKVRAALRQGDTKVLNDYATSDVGDPAKSSNLEDALSSYLRYYFSFQSRPARATYPQVLIAQRNYFQLASEYVQALEELRRTEVEIRGLLLIDGMSPPPGPGGEGRFRRREGEGASPNDLPDPIPPGGRPVEDRVGNQPGGGAG